MENKSNIGRSLFKTGNSWALRISKSDKENMEVNENTLFATKIEPNKKRISFVKLDEDELDNIAGMTSVEQVLEDRIGIDDVLVTNNNRLALTKSIEWNFDKVPNALISGTVGTGKTDLLFSIMSGLSKSGAVVDYIEPNGLNGVVLNQTLSFHKRAYTDKKNILTVLEQIYLEAKTRMIQMSKQHRLNPRESIANYLDFGCKPHFLVIDDYTKIFDLQLTSEDEQLIRNYLEYITKVSRTVGCFIVIATNSASADVLPNAIKANLTMKIVLGRSNDMELTRVLSWGEYASDFLKEYRNNKEVDNFGVGVVQKNVVEGFATPKIPDDFNLFNHFEEIGKLQPAQTTETVEELKSKLEELTKVE